MKAVEMEKIGVAEAIKVVDVAVPEPGPGGVRIKMEASGVS